MSMEVEVEEEIKPTVYIYTSSVCRALSYQLKTELVNTTSLQLKDKLTLEAMADDKFKQEFLEAHTQYRKQHQVPELTYSDELCSAAQKWADHLLTKRSLGHSDTENGENVFYSFSSAKKVPSGKAAVDSWYSEIKDYNFSTPGHQPNTGHFTQVVWKSSTELGVGLATDGNTVFVVGQYKPAGNITNAGYYEENVLPKTE